MQFFRDGFLLNLLLLAAVLAAAGLLRRVLPPLRRLAVPDSILAGTLGLVLGPAVLAILPFDQKALEVIVYHGLAVVYIAVGLQQPARGAGGAGARSIAFAMPFMAVLQGLVGLAGVAAWSLVSGNALHPGFGLLLPLGFQQGPGQALSIGGSWEASGFPSGGQIGLIFASIGFAWCILGVPLVAVARKLGWLDAPLADAAAAGEGSRPRSVLAPGAMEPLTLQLVAIASVYAAVYLLLLGLDRLLAGRPQLAAQLWGFHFILGGGAAIATRLLLGRLRLGRILDDELLSRSSAVIVDFTTAAALAAIQVMLLRAWIGPIALITAAGGGVTLLAALWLGKRAFPDLPFQHSLVLFGASTGTVPTGLALVRIVDPELRGPATRNIVLGTTGAILLGLPLVLVIMPLMVNGWASGSLAHVGLAVAALLLYLPALLAAWRWSGALRLLRPLTSVWPEGSAQSRAVTPRAAKAAARST